MPPTPIGPAPGGSGITRRGFLLGAAAGLAAGAPLGWLALRGSQWLDRHAPAPFTGHSAEEPRPAVAMPGPFPGRVVEVRHPGAVADDYTVSGDAVRDMMRQGMRSLTGSDDVQEAWKRFFAPGDVVGIKVNPVGRAPLPGEDRAPGARGSISSPEVLAEVVRCLHEYAGIPRHDIIVFERYALEFRQAGYEALMRTRPLDGVRWLASSYQYDDDQLAIDGQSAGAGRDEHVVGYDPDVFVSMGFAGPGHSPRDDRRFRSHLSLIVTRMVNKIITIPCLKDHRSAGVTLALKNLSHGMNNNVCRSHVQNIYRLGGAVTGANQCNTFIPTAVAQRPLMEKATLHILDGLVGVYEGGPGSWNATWGTWARKSLFFATDPVAMDHVGWDVIDAKRAVEGWAPVAHMGMVQRGASYRLSPRLAALAALAPPEGAMAVLLDYERRRAAHVEGFDRRQPEHIALAGLLGLGRFPAHEIDHRVVQVA
jgi:uncharacterized protein (DUF362 family)